MMYKSFALIFGVVGLIPLLIGLGFAINTVLFITQAQVADGVVIQAAPPGVNYKSVGTIQFTAADGQPYTFQSGVRTSPPEFREGQRVKVYYNSSNPSGSAQADSFISLWFSAALFGFIGLIFFGIGVAFGIAWVSAVRKRNWLYLHGKRVTSVITGIRVDKSVKKMGESPFFVVCEWHDPNNIPYFFKSDRVWKLPEFASKVGNPVEVLFDPSNSRRYFVEIMPGK